MMKTLKNDNDKTRIGKKIEKVKTKKKKHW